MTITYELGEALYLNITNRCSNNCSFCVRNSQQGLAPGTNLWLDREPDVDAVLADIEKWNVDKFQEFVFCGYGEPMIRTYTVIRICEKLKELYKIPIRINTNGHANLICNKDMTPMLAGLVDAVSISMNAKNSKEYQRICLSQYGEKAYDAMLDFAAKCKSHVPQVQLTVVDVMTPEDIEVCRKIAGEIGVAFKVRHYVKTGDK